jgi:methylthioribose-1-phosphate isomerase
MRVVPAGVAVKNPAFDVTPAGLITAIITERGIVPPVELERLAPEIREA